MCDKTIRNPGAGFGSQCAHTYITSRIHHHDERAKTPQRCNWLVVRWSNGAVLTPAAERDGAIRACQLTVLAVRRPLGWLAGCRCLHPDTRSCMLLRRVRPADSPSMPTFFACFVTAPFPRALFLFLSCILALFAYPSSIPQWISGYDTAVSRK